MIFEDWVYKVFQPSDRSYKDEIEAYNLLRVKTPDIIPEFFDEEIAGYNVIRLPPLKPVKQPRDEAEATKLKKSLTEVLQKLWTLGYAHGDVIQPGNNLIRLSNFMRSGERIVLIDLESFREDPDKYEQEQWETATFQTSADLRDVNLAAMSLAESKTLQEGISGERP